jgi:hypothetical protein
MMMMRGLAVAVVGSMLVATAALPLAAQTATPQTYSFTQDPAIPLMGPMTITLARDGSKEVVDQVFPPSTTQPKGFHAHLVYDFQAHKIWTLVVTDPSTPCSVMDYTSPAAPAEFDVISGGPDLMKELTSDAKEPMKQVGTETVNGIPAKVFEENGAGGKGKIWIAVNGGYPVKVDSIDPSGKEETIIELKHLSFAKPAAASFTPPPGCQQVQGTSSATGGSVQVGGDNKPAHNVTAATLKPIANYHGTCPAKITMTGTVTTDGPGTVWYWFSAGNTEPGDTLTFTAAGTKTVTHTMTFDPKYGNTMGVGAGMEAVMEDDKGNHAIIGTASNNSEFNVECTNRQP